MFPSLSFFHKKKVLLLAHSGADVDAVAGCTALFLALRKKADVKIGVVSHINLPAKALAKNMKINYSINPDLNAFDCVTAVDFNSEEMAGSLKESFPSFKGKIFAIDHHTKSKKPLTKNAIVKEEAVSTTEILYEMFKKNKVTITPKIAQALAAGIITDSAHFLTADSKTFSIMADLMEKGGKPFASLNALFRIKADVSEKIAKLKAAKRVRIYKLGNFIAATSDVGAYEADAATVLVKVGADVAFVGDLENSRLRISGRAGNEFVKKTNLDLAENIFQPLGKFFKGSGGGHAAAAAFNGTAESLDAAMEKCITLLSEFFGKQAKEYK